VVEVVLGQIRSMYLATFVRGFPVVGVDANDQNVLQEGPYNAFSSHVEVDCICKAFA
jgi:hypothetical protein